MFLYPDVGLLADAAAWWLQGARAWMIVSGAPTMVASAPEETVSF